MIDFYFQVTTPIKRDYLLPLKGKKLQSGLKYYAPELTIILPENFTKINIKGKTYIIIGDLIADCSDKNKFFQENFSGFSPIKIRDFKGHYIIIEFNFEDNQVNFYNSLFSLFPIYYLKRKNIVFISSKVSLIKENSNQDLKLNYRFLLENILFNYQLFDNTYLQDVKLLPSNSFLKIKNVFSIEQHTFIEEFFLSNPISLKASKFYLADLFTKQASYYFPDELFNIALTGGFDGRTLLACALKQHKKDLINTYCFGNHKSLDIKFAHEMALETGVRFMTLNLDEEYICNESLTNGLEFIRLSEGNASFARAHYLFSAKKISKISKILISGNFGSDILRGFNVAGVMVSPLTVRLFSSNYTSPEIFDILFSSYEISFLNRDFFSQFLEELSYDLAYSPYLMNEYKLSLNQIFYKWIFEELFRKYFGPEIQSQAKFITNRTPYLDFTFLQELLKTEFAGANQNFFEKNPLRRFKGQKLYPIIIKQTHPKLGEIRTDNGYSPNDILNFYGILNITKGYVNKKFFKVKRPSDPFSVKASFNHNNRFFKNLIIDENIFNKDVIHKEFHSPQRKEVLYITLSQMWLFNNFQ